MKHIKLFEYFDIKSNSLSTEIGDKLQELWHELKLPLEKLESNIKNYRIHPNLHGIKDNYISTDRIYTFELASSITRIIEKMKSICKENGIDGNSSIYSSINDILYVIPEDWQSNREVNQDDIDRFSIGYKSYNELGKLFVNESQEIDFDLSEQVDWWGVATAALLGPLGLAYKESPEKAKQIVKGALLGPLLASKTGQSAMKNMINTTPAGIIKNMSIAAAKGDATNFKTAWTAAQKYSAKDMASLEKAAFEDMKSFGAALKKMGF